jgi:hypothetical protein
MLPSNYRNTLRPLSVNVERWPAPLFPSTALAAGLSAAAALKAEVDKITASKLSKYEYDPNPTHTIASNGDVTDLGNSGTAKELRPLAERFQATPPARIGLNGPAPQ